jgi:benzoate transport
MTSLVSPRSLRQMIDTAPMGALQWRAIALCFFINMVDGIDVLVMAFTASAVAKEWQLTQVAVGWLLSAGIIGMTLGSLLLAPLADKFGRRPIVLGGLLAAGACMVATEWVNSPWALGTLRFLTGIGIGAVLVQANVLTSEYSNARWRALNIGLQSVGFALGATFGGMMAAYLHQHGTWHDVFVWGGVLSWICAFCVAVGLPESLDQLLQGRKVGDFSRAQALLQRMGHTALAKGQLRAPSSALYINTGALQSLQLLWASGAAKTWLLGASFFALMFCFYFVTSWTPKLLEQSGLSAEHGMAGGVLLHIGGMIGALALGICASRWQLQRVAQLFMALGCAALLLVVPATGWPLLPAMLLGLCVGLLLNGSVAGIYATAPQTFEAHVRSTGVGIVLSFGRLGGMASPVMAGYLLDQHWSIGHVYNVYAVVLLIAVLLLFVFTQMRKA